MNKPSDSTEAKRWVLLEHSHIRHSKKILLLLFLYSLAFTLLLVGLKIFCRNLADPCTAPAARVPQAGITQDARNAQARQAGITQNVRNAQTQQAGITHNAQKARMLQEDIAENIIRLHVIANSDTAEDQRLKLEVRDEILSQIQDSLRQADSPAQARQILHAEKNMISETAAAKIRQEGYDYPVRVIYETRYFPAKAYGDLIFPPGNYQALCIEIGAAGGKNWWCVLFPSLCFVNETTAVVPEKSKEKLQDAMSAEAYQSLDGNGATEDSSASPGQALSPSGTPASPENGETEPEFRSAILDWIRQRK